MRILYLAIFILATQLGIAQIPNAGFENWENINTWNDTPVDWQTGNNQLQEPVTKDLDAYEGEYAMRVTSVAAIIGEYGAATTTVDIDYIPASLDFYAKTASENGAVIVRIAFFNGDFEFSSHEWFTSETLEDWTFVSIPLTQNEPVLTHATIQVIATVGDFAAGDAEISVDAMSFGTTSGINDFESFDMALYPNPAQEFIQIENGSERITTLSFFDVTGRLVKQVNNSGDLSRIEIADLPNGIYTIKAKTIENKVSVRKLVVKK